MRRPVRRVPYRMWTGFEGPGLAQRYRMSIRKGLTTPNGANGI